MSVRLPKVELVEIKIFGAGDARSNVQKLKNNNLNFQRKRIMERIEGSSLNGNSQIILDYPDIKLYEDDYKFFESLGYNVIREEFIRYSMISNQMEYCVHRFGIISWD